MAEYVAAIDQGTTSTRCMLFNHAGEPMSAHQLEHEQIFPRPGWVEHDPMEIWERTRQTVRTALGAASAKPGDIAAVGVTNQRETTLVWDPKTGQPFYNAIVWQDTRTGGICEALARAGGQDRFRARTGLPLATYFSGPKIRWLLENVAGLRQRAESGDAVFGNMDTWLIWNLTGGTTGGAHVTDVTNASRTLLMDLETARWDAEILETMGIPEAMLPEIRPSSDPVGYGYTLEGGPFGERIPVCGDLGDQQAATVGQACFERGEAKNTYGTGCFMLLNTGNEAVQSKNGLLTTACYKFGEDETVYALEGSIAVTGALVQWLRDNLGLIESSEEVETLARTVDDNGGIYFVPAFSGLFAPHWRSDARGAIARPRRTRRGRCWRR
jgi:glycerol kinase